MSAAFPLPVPDALPPLPRTDDPKTLIATALKAFEEGHGVALVTLVGVTGRSARAIGAQMIVLDDGRHCGQIAGGCVEPAIAAEAATAIASGHGRMLRIGEGSPFFDIILPCGGGMELAVHIVRDPAPFEQALTAFAARTRFALAIDMANNSITFSHAKETGWAGTVFHRAFRPAARLVICGRGIETQALAQLADASGIDVMVFTPDPDMAHALKAGVGDIRHITGTEGFDDEAIDRDSALVLLFHDLDWERAVLRKALARPAFYIGALGSRTTHERRCAALADDGISALDISRVKGPVGAFGPARDSATLAASILADVFAAHSEAP